MTTRQLKISSSGALVMVDDNVGDLRLVKICLERSRLSNPWMEFTSGPDFLEFLGEAKAGKAPIPALVLLDINMPQMSGLDVLRRVKSDPAFSDLPVFCMFTSSADPKDRDRALDLGAAGFVTKPGKIEGIVEFLDDLA